MADALPFYAHDEGKILHDTCTTHWPVSTRYRPLHSPDKQNQTRSQVSSADKHELSFCSFAETTKAILNVLGSCRARNTTSPPGARFYDGALSQKRQEMMITITRESYVSIRPTVNDYLTPTSPPPSPSPGCSVRAR